MHKHSRSWKNQKGRFPGYHAVCDNDFQGLCHRWKACYPNLPGVWRPQIVRIIASSFSSHWNRFVCYWHTFLWFFVIGYFDVRVGYCFCVFVWDGVMILLISRLWGHLSRCSLRIHDYHRSHPTRRMSRQWVRKCRRFWSLHARRLALLFLSVGETVSPSHHLRSLFHSLQINQRLWLRFCVQNDARGFFLEREKVWL